MTKLSRCKCVKDGVEACVSMSGLIIVFIKCLDPSPLGKSSSTPFSQLLYR